MKLIVGLGNPGEKYQNVRHNLGFIMTEELGKRVKGQGGSWKYEEKFKSEIFNFTLNASSLTLVKPQTYMNNSGMAVVQLVDYFKVMPQEVIIIHDDLDLPLGKIKIRLGGAAAGHHGVESVIKALGTDQFIRVRLGIGNLRTQSAEKKGQTISAEKFVLEPFMPGEKSKVRHMLKQAIAAVETLLSRGLESAQNQFNG